MEKTKAKRKKSKKIKGTQGISIEPLDMPSSGRASPSRVSSESEKEDYGAIGRVIMKEV